MSEPGAGARPDHQEDRVATPNFVILYVDNPISSAAFYARLLDRPALETSPTFAMFSLHDGVMLGLWSRHTVQPGASATAGAAEIAFTADSKEAVQESAHRLDVQRPARAAAADADGLRLHLHRRRPRRPSPAGLCSSGRVTRDIVRGHNESARSRTRTRWPTCRPRPGLGVGRSLAYGGG